MSKDSHALHDVKTAVLGVALSNKKPDSETYEAYKQNLINQLNSSGEELTKEPIPFYKKGVASPAGYVIETNKEVLICYHGTQFGKVFGSGGKEILHDIQFTSSSMDFGGQKVSVHSGFKTEFESSKDSLYQALAQTNLKEKTVHLSGHSLGGAVAQIAAMDLTTHFGINVNKVTTFGGPRVFTKNAAELYNSKGLGDVTLRVKQDRDPVPRIVPRGMYHHTGDKIKLPNPKGGLHSGSVYRNIALNKITEQDIQNKRSSDKPWSFTELYLKPVMQLTKSGFAKLYKNTSTVRDVGSELVHKIKKNPWKTLGTVLLATAFPAGTIIAGAIATGVVAKSGYDAHVNKKASQGKGDEPRGMLSELGHKIKKNPWKTLGTVLLATAFPAGTIIAGAIATGVAVKSGYDAHVNKKASKPEVSPHTPTSPKHHKQPYSPQISPPPTPTINRGQFKAKTTKRSNTR